MSAFQNTRAFWTQALIEQLDDEIISKISEFFFEQVIGLLIPITFPHECGHAHVHECAQGHALARLLLPFLAEGAPARVPSDAVLCHNFTRYCFVNRSHCKWLQHYYSPEMVRYFGTVDVSYSEALHTFSSLRSRGLRLHYWP